ncbi:MAG TPA: hypothetical protein VF765_26750 [Polyangiaceae bacterium]
MIDTRALSLAAVVTGLLVEGCATHSEITLPVRDALDAGNPHAAIALLDEQMDVKAPTDLPAEMDSENSLFVLDRGSIQQSIAQFKDSKRDLEAADKAIDMLDLAHDAKDDIGSYIFSGSAGKYQAPPYEKLLVNTLDMVNYLELQDLNGARVEARRLAVMQKYISDDLKESDNPVLGLGGFLAGLTFEESEQPDEALRWYDQALQFAGFHALRDPVRLLLTKSQYRSPRLKDVEAGGPPPAAPEDQGQGEIVFVVGYGRVPHKIPHRIPIGLALTWFSGALAPNDVAAANRIAAQGLVTWVNYPTLGPEQGKYAIPAATIDGQYVQLEEAVNVTDQVRGEWKKIEGKIIVSAITRMIARFAAGSIVGAVAGQKNGIIGLLANLGTQATLTVLDKPDTRSWETLPARVAIARVRVAAGSHTVHLDARGVRRDLTLQVDKGGCSVVSLMALR